MNIEMEKARLTLLLGGRPFDFGPAPDGYEKPHHDGKRPWMLTIYHENDQHYVYLIVTDADLDMGDAEFKERWIRPAVNNLDGAVYPKRLDRLLQSERNYVEMLAILNEKGNQ